MDQWEKLEALYLHAISLNANEQSALVAELRTTATDMADRLLRMLEASSQTNHYLESLQWAMAHELEELNYPELKEGSKIGNYSVLKSIGKGGMGRVYLAERADGAFEQHVAIKILSRNNLNRWEEQRLLGKLQHTHIAQIYDAGSMDAYSYIVMEYVNGLSIDRYIDNYQLNITQSLALFLQLCDAIHYAHRNFILHQDIKPANILVNQTGQVKVLDFGIGQRIDQEQEPSIAATPYYASPEQLQGKSTNVSSDVFQLGILLYKLICKQLPFESKIENELITRPLADAETYGFQPYKPHILLRGELESIVKKCLSLNAQERFQSVDNLSRAIRDYLDQKPVECHSNSKLYRAGKYVRRNRLFVGSFTLLMIAIVTAMIFSMRQAQIARLQKEKAEVTADFLTELFASANPFDNSSIDHKEYKYLDFIKERKDMVLANQSLSFDQKWEVLTLLQRLFFNLTEWDQALQTTEAMLNLALQQQNEEWLAESYFQLGSVYTQQFEFDKAEASFEMLAPLLTRIEARKSERMILYSKEIGLHYHLSGMYEEAEKYYLYALNYARKINSPDHEEVIRVYGSYSQLLRSLGKFDSALLLANKTIALKLERVKGDSMNVNMSNSYADRALIYMEDADYELAERDFHNSISIIENKWDSLNQNYEFVMGNYVILKNFKGEHDKAIGLARKLKRHVEEVYGSESVSGAYAHLHLGESLTAAQILDEGKAELERGKALVAQLLGEQHILYGIFNQIQCKNALMSGDFESAEILARNSLMVFETGLPPDHYRQLISKIRQAYAQWKKEAKEESKTEIKRLATQLTEQGKRATPYLKELESYLTDL